MGYNTRRRGDEFYTKREDVEMMLNQYLPIFQQAGVRILCPCDTGESAFVNFFLDNDCNVTWSDALDYDQFDFSDFDFVVTNPPFSLMGDFLKKLKNSTAGGFIIMPVASLVTEGGQSLLQDGWLATDEGVPTSFLTPDSGELQFGMIAALRSQGLAENVHAGSKRRESPRGGPIISDEGMICYGRVSSVPDKWEGDIAVPISWACVKYDPNRYEIVSHRTYHINGKETFNRFIIRCRPQEKGQS